MRPALTVVAAAAAARAKGESLMLMLDESKVLTNCEMKQGDEVGRILDHIYGSSVSVARRKACCVVLGTEAKYETTVPVATISAG
jgi:hypothetical protein